MYDCMCKVFSDLVKPVVLMTCYIHYSDYSDCFDFVIENIERQQTCL